MVETKKTSGPFSPSNPTFALIVLGIVGVAAGLIIGIDLLAVLVAPPVLVVGLIGLPVAFRRSRQSKHQQEGRSTA
jgi:Flp pilus assembly protein TadB